MSEQPGPARALGSTNSSPSQTPPSTRWGGQLAEDPAEGYALLFSGSSGSTTQNGTMYGDTWAYKTGSWFDLSPPICTSTTCPLARTLGAMAYYSNPANSSQKYVVLFGGRSSGANSTFLGDTWIFNGTWHNVTPSPLHAFTNSPPTLSYVSMTWDAADGYAVLYGGCTIESACSARLPSNISSETWAFEGINAGGRAQWVNLTGPVHPPPLYADAMAFDSAQSSVVLFGGTYAQSGHLTNSSQTWTYSGAGGWVNRTSLSPNMVNTPPPRQLTVMSYYPANGYVVLFGGLGGWGNKSADNVLADTWAYSAGNWTDLTSGSSPHSRFSASFAFDPSDNALVLFGGLSGTPIGSPVLGDTWWFGGSPGVWTNQTGIPAAFNESGLLAHTRWTVTLSPRSEPNVTLNSTTGSITFDEPSGTYGYVIAPIPGYHITTGSYTGSVTVNASNPPTITIHWSQVKYVATFSASGLPASTRWYINISGAGSHTSTSATITANVPNGTFTYTSATVNHLYAASYASNLVVNGGNLTVPVRFGFGYRATFSESGLPSGAVWYANITNGGPPLNGTGTSLSTSLPNGTYTYSIATADKDFAPASGSNFTVNGGPFGGSVIFTPISFSTTFSSSGLLPGDTWYVNITGGPSLNGTGETLTTSLVIGIYAFHAATSDKRYAPNYTPILVILGTTSMEVNFTAFTYPVTVHETGLPSGTSWSVTANTVTYSSATTMLTFPATNGTSGYVATVLSGTGGTPGTLTVRGAPLSVNVAFYKSSFPESGLPKGTNWQLTTNGMTENSTGSPIAFYLTNGTYGYTASVSPGAGGTAVAFSVNGSARTSTVAFFKVKFTESGLPAGMTWQVTANGVAENSSGTTITYYLANGTYSYEVGPISGYHTTGTGSLTVSGITVSRSVTFSRTTYLVKFAETGLTVGTKWCVTFDGVQTCATGSLISFSQIVNGTYGYSIGAVKNYSLGAAYAGTVTVAGGGQGTSAPSVNVPWTLVKYKITFTESGLPSHTNWQVTLNGKVSSSTGTTITFTISNGTYAFSIVSTGYPYTSSPTSPLTVNGAAVPVAVTFT